MSQQPQAKHTLFYVSGSSYQGEYYIIKHRKRLEHCGVLLSYNDLSRRGCTWKRLVDLKGV